MKRIATFAALTALAIAGCGGGEEKPKENAATDTNTGTASSPPPPAGESTKLKADADPSGALKFTKDALTAKAGEVTIEMDNPSEIPHAVGIEGNGVEAEGQTVEKGGTSTVTASLKPGTYTFYCPVPGHEPAGMKGELTVE